MLLAIHVAVIAGCASDDVPDPTTEEGEATSDALTTGGCPMSKIREWQGYCATNYCPSIGKKSRGIDGCKWIDQYTQIAHCICR